MDGSIPTASPAAPHASQPPLSIAALAEQITELAGHLNAASYRWLTLIAEFDRREGWSDGAVQSCAHWLNFTCGLDFGAAREKVRVAHALEGLPKIAAAMARGELSYSKVRALTRVAEPATEDYFLSIALGGTASHVERLVRHYRNCLEAEALSREANQMALRYLCFQFESDGSVVVKGRLPALAGEMLKKAVEAAAEQLPPSDLDVESDVDAGLRGAPPKWQRPHPWSARRADALALVAESFLAHGAPAMKSADRHQVVVHVDEETLRNRTAGRCGIDAGPALPAETVRRIACDAAIVPVLENEAGDVLDVGRKTRSIPPAIRRALNARDKGCRFPGCTHQRYVDAHHIQHWADGGATKMANLVMLCRFHHRLVHEGSVVIETRGDGAQGGGALRFVRPDGRPYEDLQASGRACEWTALARTHACKGPAINAHTAVSAWRGERMDYGLAIFVLLQQSKRAKELSAETSRAPGSAM